MLLEKGGGKRSSHILFSCVGFFSDFGGRKEVLCLRFLWIFHSARAVRFFVFRGAVGSPLLAGTDQHVYFAFRDSNE